MFASIKSIVTNVRTAVSSALSKRWVKVVGIAGVVTVAVGGAALIFPAAATAVAGGVVTGFKSVGNFFSSLFTSKDSGGAAAPSTEAVAA